MRRVLVTGASGFVGTYLSRRLLANGVEVIGLGRTRASLQNLPAGVRGEATDYGEELVELLSGVDTVFHLAGRRSTREDDPLRVAPFVGSAIAMLDNILRSSATNGVKRIVQASSIAVYSGENSAPYREDDHAKPIGPYGVMKLFCEQAADFWSMKTGIPVSHARIAQCYGHGEKLTPALMGMMDRASRGVQLTVKDGGHYKIDEVYVEDVVNALIDMASQNANGAFNIGSGEGYSVLQIAETANRVYGREGHLTVEPVGANARPGTPRHMDISKATTVLGWTPKYSLSDGMAAMRIAADNAKLHG